jgi:type IV pilus assembly protein PilE
MSTASDFPRMRSARRSEGFTLIELMIVVVIIGILATIAYPSYVKSVAKSNRKAGEACLSSYATFMERFYTTNLRYDHDTDDNDVELPDLDCASDGSTGKSYGYELDATKLSASTYGLKAVPTNAQASRDAECGTLTLDQAGTRGAAGSTDAEAVEKCW